MNLYFFKKLFSEAEVIWKRDEEKVGKRRAAKVKEVLPHTADKWPLRRVAASGPAVSSL